MLTVFNLSAFRTGGREGRDRAVLRAVCRAGWAYWAYCSKVAGCFAVTRSWVSRSTVAMASGRPVFLEDATARGGHWTVAIVS